MYMHHLYIVLKNCACGIRGENCSVLMEPVNKGGEAGNRPFSKIMIIFNKMIFHY